MSSLNTMIRNIFELLRSYVSDSDCLVIPVLKHFKLFDTRNASCSLLFSAECAHSLLHGVVILGKDKC